MAITLTTANNLVDDIISKRVSYHDLQLQKVYQASFLSIDKELAALNGKGVLTSSEMYKYNRLVSLQENILVQLRQLGFSTVTNALIDMFKTAHVAEAYTFKNISDRATFTAIDNAIIKGAVFNPQQTIEIIKTFNNDWLKTINKTKFIKDSDSYFMQLMNKNNLAQKQRVWETLTTGLVQGKSYAKMSRDVQDVFENGYNNALRVMRTEGHKAQIMGQLAGQEQAVKSGLDVVDFWIATGDLRTRPHHASINGQLKNDEGVFVLPGGAITIAPSMSGIAAEDINCRCRLGHIVNGVEPDNFKLQTTKTAFNEGFESYFDELY